MENKKFAIVNFESSSINHDILDGFTCSELDLFKDHLKEIYELDSARTSSRTLLLINEESNDLAGYVSYSIGRITLFDSEYAPVDSIDRETPVLVVEKLAIDDHYRNIGCGTLLLAYISEMAYNVNLCVNIFGVFLQSLYDSVEFYQRNEYILLEKFSYENIPSTSRTDSYQMILPIKLINEAFEQENNDSSSKSVGEER